MKESQMLKVSAREVSPTDNKSFIVPLRVPYDSQRALEEYCPEIQIQIIGEDQKFRETFGKAGNLDFEVLAEYTHQRAERKLQALLDLPFAWRIYFAHNWIWPGSVHQDAKAFAYGACIHFLRKRHDYFSEDFNFSVMPSVEMKVSNMALTSKLTERVSECRRQFRQKVDGIALSPDHESGIREVISKFEAIPPNSKWHISTIVKWDNQHDDWLLVSDSDVMDTIQHAAGLSADMFALNSSPRRDSSWKAWFDFVRQESDLSDCYYDVELKNSDGQEHVFERAEFRDVRDSSLKLLRKLLQQVVRSKQDDRIREKRSAVVPMTTSVTSSASAIPSHKEIEAALEREDRIEAVKMRLAIWKSVGKQATNVAIQKAAGVDHSDFYAWRRGEVKVSSSVHKNLSRVLIEGF
jgi:hypothetical protein